MQKRSTEEKNYNHYNIDGSTLAEKKARVYKDIENTLPCYACEQGLGNESSGLWKAVDDMIFYYIFINGIDYTAKELFNHINATRLEHSTEEDIIVRPCTVENIKTHMEKHSSNIYWRTRKILDTTTEMIERLIYDEYGEMRTLTTKEERDTYNKLTETQLKTLDKIELLKKQKNEASKKA